LELLVRRTPVLIVLSALALAGCGGSSTGNSNAAPVASSAAASPTAGSSPAATEPVVLTVGEQDTSKNALSADLSVGQSVYVDLFTCGGCGYSWTVDKSPDAAVAATEQVAQPTPSAPSSGPPLVGAPTTTRLAFTAVKSGATSVSIGYHGPGAAKADRVDVLTITVSA
jgi:hypothetical protein